MITAMAARYGVITCAVAGLQMQTYRNIGILMVNKVKKPKKTNPNKIPVSQADLKKAVAKAQNDALTTAIAIMLTVLCDKEGADAEIMQRVWKEINELSDSVVKGYVKISELVETLETEYQIYITDSTKK